MRRIAAIALGLLMSAAPLAAEDTAHGRLAAWITNAYLAEFTDYRRDVARVEMLSACGDQDTLIPFLDRVVAAELDLRRDLIARAETLEAEGLPPVAERRSFVTSVLDAFDAVDATNRAIAFAQVLRTPPGAAICESTRRDVMELLEHPQPTLMRK